jgi:hypothetical protein
MKSRLAVWVTILIAVMAMGSLYAGPVERSKAKSKLKNRLENRKHGISVKAKRPEAVSHLKSIPSSLRKTNPGIDMPAITRFPFQYDFFMYSSGFPVIAAFGEIMIIYTSDWASTIQYSKSSSGGAEWSEPVEVTESTSPEQISGIRTTEGRIIAVWREMDFVYQLSMIHSDDEGVTWSEKNVIENEALMPFSPTVYQSADGRLWLFYSRTYDWETIETVYRISEDGGDTWGPDSVFPTGGYWATEVTLLSEPGMPVVALYDEGDAFSSIIYARALLASGEWTDPATPVTNPGDYAFHPRAFRKSDGSQVLVYTKQDKYWWNPFFDYDQTTIETMTYRPVTDTWSDPIPFTRYAGWNDFSNACLLEDKPFIVFASDRWGTYAQLWFGLAGESEDVNPPPAFLGSMFPEPRSNRHVTLLAYAFDESAVSAVRFTLERDGGAMEGPFAMSDDGLHGDSLAGDGLWGAVVGPFNPGEQTGFTFTVLDDGGNTVETNTWEFTTPAVHDAGNMVLRIGENSVLAYTDMDRMGAYWPKENGLPYLYSGGFWAGAKVGAEKLVSNVDWGTWDWERVAGTPFTVGPGLSDQDVNVTYADTSEWAASSIGLAVHQTSLQWSDPAKDDFIIFNYSMRNSGDSGDLDSLFAGMWLDPDVPWAEWDNNLAGFDAARQMLIVRSAGEEPAGLFGVRMLGPGKAPFSAHALPYDEEIGDSFDDVYRYDLMTAGTVTVPEDSGDYRLLVTHPPFALASGDSFTVSFGIVLGNGMEELQANADTMLAVYRRLQGPSAVDHSCVGLPLSFGLDQNHPNPFNPSTSIEFRLASDGPVSVRVYDLMGRLVAVLANRRMATGSHRLEWNASGFESGVYFCRIQAGDFRAVRKMVLMK